MAKSVEQIATDLGLSITTIRLVLNGKADQYRISARTQERINRYVAEHGYTLNYTARSLKLNKTDTLGLIIPRLSNSFFSNLAEELELRCHEEGYHLVISSSYSDSQREKKLVESMVQRNIDGLFIVPSSRSAQKHHVERAKKPIVVLDRDFGLDNSALVVSDNFNGGVELTHAMLSARAEPIIFLGGDIQQPSIHARLEGYQQALASHGLPVQPHWILESAHNRRMDGEKMMHDYMSRHAAPPNAFIASSQPVLEGALSQLRTLRGYISRDINIGTFDEHPMLSFLPNNLWSVKQDENIWADEAFNTMLHILQRETPNHVRRVIPMTLIWRQRSVH